MKALIVVDVQRDFCEGGSLAVNGSEEIIPIINDLTKSDEYDRIIFTADWHPCEHKSFASNWDGKNVFDVVKLGEFDQVLWPDHCIAGEEGAYFHKDLITCRNMCRSMSFFTKGENPELDSYSGFYDNDHSTSTGLKEFLVDKGITDVDVCGLATDFCVKFTALDSKSSGFNTSVLMSASRGVFLGGPEDEQKTIDELKEAGVHIS